VCMRVVTTVGVGVGDRWLGGWVRGYLCVGVCVCVDMRVYDHTLLLSVDG